MTIQSQRNQQINNQRSHLNLHRKRRTNWPSRRYRKFQKPKGNQKSTWTKVRTWMTYHFLSQSQHSFCLTWTNRNFLINFSLCQYHKEKNSIYCEICEQPGCQQCIVYGPHNNQMHRVNKIDESFKARYLYLNELVCGELIERRDRLNKRLGDLTVMSDELRYIIVLCKVRQERDLKDDQDLV